MCARSLGSGETTQRIDAMLVSFCTVDLVECCLGRESSDLEGQSLSVGHVRGLCTNRWYGFDARFVKLLRPLLIVYVCSYDLALEQSTLSLHSTLNCDSNEPK